MIYDIKPVIGFGRTATTIDIKVIEYQFGDKLKIYYSLNDNDVITSGNIIYGSDIIANWNDDGYIIDLVINDLGLERI